MELNRKRAAGEVGPGGKGAGRKWVNRAPEVRTLVRDGCASSQETEGYINIDEEKLGAGTWGVDA